MREEIATLRRLDPLIWGILLIAASVVLLIATITDFHVVWVSFLGPALTAAVLVVAAWFYRGRRDPRRASALCCAAQIVTCATIAAPLSYIAASFDLPLQNDLFRSADRALGLNGLALPDTIGAGPALIEMLRVLNANVGIQVAIAVLALAFTGRLVRLRTFTLAFTFATLASIAISAVLPADFSADMQPPAPEMIVPAAGIHALHELRDGTLRMLSGLGAEPIVTFPSLDAAMAVILVAAIWPIAALRWLGIALNGLMVVAIAVDGAHDAAGVLAGLLLGSMAVAAAAAAAQRVTNQASRIAVRAKAASVLSTMPAGK